MLTVEDLIKFFSLEFRKGKTELQIKNYEKEWFVNQEISFIALLDEIKVEPPNLKIWLKIPSIIEAVGESGYSDGLYYEVTDYKYVSVIIDYPLSKDNSTLSSISKNEKVFVKGIVSQFYENLLFMSLIFIEKTDKIEQRPSSVRKLPEEGPYYEYNKKHLKEKEQEEDRKKSNCFIATACYGNYNAPEVLVLRQYRDSILLKTFPGRMFVKFYYSVSPFCAKQISRSESMKKFAKRFFLDPTVSLLRKKDDYCN